MGWMRVAYQPPPCLWRCAGPESEVSDGENSLPLSVSLAGLTQWLRHRRQTAASFWLPRFAIWKPVTSLPQTSAAALCGCLLLCLRITHPLGLYLIGFWRVCQSHAVLHVLSLSLSPSSPTVTMSIFPLPSSVLTHLDLWPSLCHLLLTNIPFLLTKTILLLPACVCKRSIPPGPQSANSNNGSGQMTR